MIIRLTFIRYDASSVQHLSGNKMYSIKNNDLKKSP